MQQQGDRPRTDRAASRAMYNYRVLARGRQVQVPASAATAPAPRSTLSWRENADRLPAARVRRPAGSTTVASRARTRRAKAAVVGAGEPAGQTAASRRITRATRRKRRSAAAELLVADRVVDTQGEANALARARSTRAQGRLVRRGRGHRVRQPGVRAGAKVKIEGVGTPLRRRATSSPASTHVYSGKTGYQTNFRDLGRAPTRGLLDLMRPPERRDWSQRPRGRHRDQQQRPRRDGAACG